MIVDITSISVYDVPQLKILLLKLCHMSLDNVRLGLLSETIDIVE